MMDEFESTTPGISGPAENVDAVIPNDSADLALATRALYVGGFGNVAVVTVGGSDVIFAEVAAGSVLPVRVRRVKATGTTATAILGLR